MIDSGKLAIKDFTYILPDEYIAQFPLSNRSNAKLLVFDVNRKIQHHIFSAIPSLIPEGSLVIMNNTKVIQARLLFHKSTGAKIEVFCLEPYKNLPIEEAFQTKGNVQWKCMIGNAKKWKEEELIFSFEFNNIQGNLKAKRVGESNDLTVVQFDWLPSDIAFSEVLSHSGLIPLPPYMNRAANDTDIETYNTVYAKNDGSVAAPTSGLHFTTEVLKQLEDNNCKMDFVTLHVGAGTFKPVKAATMADHIMHEEQISISLETITHIKETIGISKIIAVGTTTTRTIESVYWHSILLMKNEIATCVINIDQWLPYKYKNDELPSAKEAFIYLCNWMIENKFNNLYGTTKIIIAPGYKFRMIDALITNFHQPKSTLLLLVAALIGDDWRKVYATALKEKYRFLSYGDSSLLYKPE